MAAGTLADRGVACRTLTVAVAGSLAPGSVIRIQVACTVGLGDVVLAGFGPSRTVHGVGVEYVDAVRGGAP
jgi:hypothetical protein